MESLAEAKGESFGDALRTSIEVEFRTQAVFAKACGLSEGRISQIIKGTSTPNAETLGRMLQTFSSWVLQERIQRAYVRDFAPLPPVPDVIDENVIHQIRQLIDAGNPRRAVRIASHIRKSIPPQDHMWQRLSEEILEGQLKLEQYGSALRTLKGMLDLGRATGKLGNLVTSYWMKNIILLALPGANASEMMDSHQQALDVLGAWKAADKEEAETIRNRKSALSRDYAHNIIRAQSGKMSDDDRKVALAAIDYSETLIEDEILAFLSAEARARVEIAAGNPFAAEEWIEAMQRFEARGGIRGQIKRLHLEAQTLKLRGMTNEAIEKLLRGSRLAMDHMHLHLHAQLQAELAIILLGKQ